MRRNATIIAIVVALIGLVYLLWPSPPSPSAAVDDSTPPATLAERRAARLAGDIDASPATVSGRVTEVDGRGIGGAIVSVAKRNLNRHERNRPGASPEPIVAVTKADGRWRIGELAPGRYTVAASAADHLPGIIDPLVVNAGEQREDVVLVLKKGGNTLRGTVVDVGGGAISGALVRATSITEGSVFSIFRAPYTALTDDRGEYGLNLADGQYWLEVFHLDYVTADRLTEVRGGDRSEDFTLTPGAIIYGQVRSRNGDKPVAGAIVTYRAQLGARGFDLAGLGLDTATSDGDGKFVLRGLANGTLSLTAFGRGFASREPTEVELGIGEHVTGVVVYVDTAFTISGFVVSKQDPNQAIDGVLVGAYNFSGAIHLAGDSTAADGYFEILGVQPGGYIVGAAGENRVLSIMGTNVTVEDKDVDDVVVELDSGVTLAGRVEPAMVARVSLELDTESIGMSNFVQAISAVAIRGKSAEDGTFVLRGVPAGSYSLAATGADGSEGKLALVIDTADQEGLVVDLEPRAYLAGTVVDSTGKPLSGLHVQARPADQERQRFNLDAMIFGGRGLSGEDGGYRVEGLAAGTVVVTVSDDRGALAWADDEHKDNPYQPIEVTIEGTTPVTGLRLVVEALGQQIQGVVISSAGEPVADAWVTAQCQWQRKRESGEKQPAAADDGDDKSNGEGKRSVTVSVGSGGTDVDSEDGESDRDSQRQQRRRQWWPKEKPVLTGPDGRFTITNLREDSYNLEAEGLKGTERGSLDDVATGGDVVITMTPLAGMTGLVKNRGDAVTDYLVRAEGPTPRRTHVVNEKGRYRLTRLDPGSYSVSIIAAAGRATQKVEVEANRTTDHDFDLISWSSIRGVVKNAATGAPMDELAVIAFAEEGSDYGQMAMDIMSGDGPTTDSEGRFYVGRLGAGKGTLLIVDGDQAGFQIVASKEFVLEPGQELDLGELLGQSVNTIPKEERGEVGMTMTTATWSGRPVGADGDPTAAIPAELTAETEYLWVSEVVADGPAAAAGVEVGDRLVAIAGADVAMVGPRVAEQLLAPRRVRAGQPINLVIDRDGRSDTLTITPRPLPAN